MSDEQLIGHVPVQNRLDAPHRDVGDKLHLVLGAYFSRRDVEAPRRALEHRAPWTAEHFGLHRTRAYQAAGAEAQRAILEGCAQGLLEEAYAIEKTGLCYCAKLCLLSESTEERMMYSLMAADEATHLRWVTPLVDSPERAGEGPFVRLISETVERGGKNALTLLMQVVLEGWGLSHYRKLADGCQAPVLRNALRSILVDEALHHGSGKHLFEPAALDDADVAFAREFMATLLSMVRVGPQGVVAQVERATGGLSATQRTELFEELACEASSQEKLSLLRGLLSANGAEALVAWLEERGLFRPLPAAACAEAMA